MRSALTLGLAALLASTTAHAATSARDPYGPASEAAKAGALDLLRQVVDIDSGTGDRPGAAKVQAIFAARLTDIGAKLETVPTERADVGDNLVATLEGSGRGRILIIAHVDTVFGPGTVAKRPFRIDGPRAYGPGVSDEKGGAVTALTALELLHAHGFKDFARITLLLEASEETGSPGSKALILKLARDHDVELNMEPGDAPDMLTVWRKGSTVFRIDVHGRAAHAGVAPQDGRNAAVELIHQLQGLEAFPHVGAGLTVNLTTLKAGERNNVIPDLASAQMSVRVRSADQVETVRARLLENAKTTVIPDTTVDVVTEAAFPPLPNNPATDALAARAQAISAGFGRPLGLGGNGGASESALAASVGTPALDGLGPVGGGFHSDKEYLEIATLGPRIHLLARLIESLGRDPPKRYRP